MMRAALQIDSETYDDPFDCPDSLIAYNEGLDRFALIVRDGERNVVLINNCPWCGARLGAAPAAPEK